MTTHSRFAFPIAVATALVCTHAMLLEASAAKLRVFPESVRLVGVESQQHLVAQVVEDDGRTRDVTSEVKWSVAAADLLKADVKAANLTPLKDGKTEVLGKFGDLSVSVPVEVSDTAGKHPVSFRRDVMPIFMRSGCNSGSCHGAGRGQDGFRLSLFGFDPKGDHYRLVEDIPGRRVDLARPEKSLVVEKALGIVNHTGGELFKKDSQAYRLLTQWITEGAQDDPDTTAPVGIRLLPEKMMMRRNAKTPPTQRTVVMAQYADGTERDVSHLALFLSNNDAVATIGKDGVVKTGASGAASLFARFSKFTVGCEAIVLPDSDKFSWPKEAEPKNYVDVAVFDRLKRLQIQPSELADDAAFLRRVSLDLTGLPPSPERLDAFLAENAPEKRAKLIDELLASPEFTDLWTMKWAEILQIRPNLQDQTAGRSRKSVWKYYEWLHQQIAVNRPFNEVVSELLTAHGSNVSGPQANFYTTAVGNARKPMERAEDVAQLFLGSRIQCAQCHNHPFDRWTMDDYFGFTAFFAGVSSKPGTYAAEVFVFNINDRNTAEHPVDGRSMNPRFLGGDEPAVDGQDPRVALAKWMTSPTNARFARTLVNRAWAHLFGRGIIEPVDDARISNPPSIEALLAGLADEFVKGKFDMRKLFRDICNSRTYQLSSKANDSNAADSTCFSRSYVRRLQAEVILDSIAAVSESPQIFNGVAAGTRAVQLYDGGTDRDVFLKNFGASKRETVCSCEVRNEPTLTQMLSMMNGNTVDTALQRSKFVDRLTDKKDAPATEGVQAIFKQVLCRTAAETEVAKFLEGQDVAKLATDRNTRRRFYEDVLWSAMNTTEFLFNH